MHFLKILILRFFDVSWIIGKCWIPPFPSSFQCFVNYWKVLDSMISYKFPMFRKLSKSDNFQDFHDFMPSSRFTDWKVSNSMVAWVYSGIFDWKMQWICSKFGYFPRSPQKFRTLWGDPPHPPTLENPARWNLKNQFFQFPCGKFIQLVPTDF